MSHHEYVEQQRGCRETRRAPRAKESPRGCLTNILGVQIGSAGAWVPTNTHEIAVLLPPTHLLTFGPLCAFLQDRTDSVTPLKLHERNHGNHRRTSAEATGMVSMGTSAETGYLLDRGKTGSEAGYLLDKWVTNAETRHCIKGE